MSTTSNYRGSTHKPTFNGKDYPSRSTECGAIILIPSCGELSEGFEIENPGISILKTEEILVLLHMPKIFFVTV